jgi:uncharacterized membrane protein YcjF (UPF0283 family)
MPMRDLAIHFMLGAIVACCAVASTFFLRFWRKTGDRLFGLFSLAFGVLAMNWVALAFTRTDEMRTWLYAIRLGAFLVILYAIVDKNRAKAA